MPRRENQARRSRTSRRARPLILIVCGSPRTEQDYLRGQRDAAANAAVDIKVVQKPKSPLIFTDYADGLANATRRAEKLGAAGKSSTGMWRLALRISNEEDQ